MERVRGHLPDDPRRDRPDHERRPAALDVLLLLRLLVREEHRGTAVSGYLARDEPELHVRELQLAPEHRRQEHRRHLRDHLPGHVQGLHHAQERRPLDVVRAEPDLDPSAVLQLREPRDLQHERPAAPLGRRDRLHLQRVLQAQDGRHLGHLLRLGDLFVHHVQERLVPHDDLLRPWCHAEHLQEHRERQHLH